MNHKRVLATITLGSALVLSACPKKEEKKQEAAAATEKKPAEMPKKPAMEEAKKEEPPEHYVNKKENLNPDPNYTPGDYPAPETAAAKKAYEEKKKSVAEGAGDGALVTQGGGELTFGIAKNEKKRVFGYFRNYHGVVKMSDKGPQSVELVVDVNSLDTAVPGRDNRIKKLFFESMKPDLGTAVLKLDEIDLGGKEWGAIQKEGGTLSSKGSLMLNGKSAPVMAKLSVKPAEGGGLSVQTAEPVLIKISDFGFGDRPYTLMKECNHKSMGNVVDLGAKITVK